MQDRHTNRSRYFSELAETSRRYFMPYVSRWHELRAGQKVLEIGCGEGGNLLPFARAGLEVTGIDIARVRISQAREFFAKAQAEGRFVCQDIFRLQPGEKFSSIICHDVTASPSCRFLPGKCLLADISRYAGTGFSPACLSSISCPQRFTKASSAGPARATTASKNCFQSERRARRLSPSSGLSGGRA